MAYEVWWALVLGFAVSAIVQAWVPRAAIERRLAAKARVAGLGHRPRCRLLVVFICRDRDRQVALSEGRVGACRAGVPVRLHEPRVGTWAGALGADRLALRTGRVPRRDRPDRDHVAAHPPVRFRARRGRSAAACATADTGHEHHMAASDEISWRARLTSTKPGRTSRTTSAATGRCSDREIIVGFLLAGFIGLVHPSVFNTLFLHSAPDWVRVPKRPGRPAHRGPQLRLLGRQRPAGGRALVGRDLLRRRDRVHLRRPDRAPDHRRSTASTTAPGSRSASPR